MHLYSVLCFQVKHEKGEDVFLTLVGVLGICVIFHTYKGILRLSSTRNCFLLIPRYVALHPILSPSSFFTLLLLFVFTVR
jgi:hypothetical protein